MPAGDRPARRAGRSASGAAPPEESHGTGFDGGRAGRHHRAHPGVSPASPPRLKQCSHSWSRSMSVRCMAWRSRRACSLATASSSTSARCTQLERRAVGPGQDRPGDLDQQAQPPLAEIGCGRAGCGGIRVHQDSPCRCCDRSSHPGQGARPAPAGPVPCACPGPDLSAYAASRRHKTLVTAAQESPPVVMIATLLPRNISPIALDPACADPRKGIRPHQGGKMPTSQSLTRGCDPAYFEPTALRLTQHLSIGVLRHTRPHGEPPGPLRPSFTGRRPRRRPRTITPGNSPTKGRS